MRRPSRRTRSQRPRQISPPPTAPAAEEDLRLEGRYRAHGRLTRATRTDAGIRQQKRTRRLSIVLAVFGFLALLALAWSAYAFETLRAQASLGTLRGDDRLRSVLREPLAPTGPVCVVLTVHDADRLVSASVVTVDPATHRAWSLSVPGRSAVPVGKEPVKVDEAYRAGEYDRIVAAMESISATQVDGFIDVDRAGARTLFGGRPANSSAGFADRHKADLLPMLRVMSETRDKFGRLAFARAAKGIVRTDLNANELARLADVCTSADIERLAIGVPTGPEIGGRCVPDAVLARRLTEQLASGKAPRSSESDLPDPGGVTVEIRNGAGLDGVAGDASRILQEAGYRVGAVGNANAFVYKETLVVYKDEGASARDVARRLPKGRAVQARGMYAFDTTLLVIVGKDWVNR